MDNKYKSYVKIYWIACLILIFFIIAVILGNTYIIYLLKDMPNIIIYFSVFMIFYISLGVFRCFKGVKLLINIKKFLNSKEVLEEEDISRLKIECKQVGFLLIVYLISIPSIIAALIFFKH